MKAFYLAAAVLAAVFSVAQAQGEDLHATRTHGHLSFVMNSKENPDETILFSCSALVDRTEAMLKEAGARDIKVNCSGAADWDRPTLDPLVTADYTSVRLASIVHKGDDVMAAWRTVVLHDYNDCSTTRQLLMKIAPGLELRNLNAAECGFHNGAYRFEFDALVEK